MRIFNAEFVKSVADKNILDDKKEIAFVGRSNVGKSSLINGLVNRKQLAKTSSTPGKTRLINYFNINNGEFYIVDLPGYGYHKAGKQFNEKWADTLENYLVNSKQLKLCFVLMDIRHKPSEQDIQMIEFLSFNRVPFVVLATKSDKLSKAQISNSVLAMAGELKMGTSNIIAVSGEKRTNLEKVLCEMEKFLNM